VQRYFCPKGMRITSPRGNASDISCRFVSRIYG
jgi:hypothetical protein